MSATVNGRQVVEVDPAGAEPHRQRVAAELSSYLERRVRAVDDAREQLRARLGVPSLDQVAAPCVEPLGRDGSATYSRIAVPLDGGLTVDGVLITPLGSPAPSPLVVAQHGGMGSPELAMSPETNYRGLIRGAVAAGYVVWAPRLYMPVPEDPHERTALDRLARRSGTTLIGVELGKLSAALTVITAMDGVDANWVAMVGLSIGGQYAMLSAALDTRISVVVAANPVLHDGWLDEIAPAGELIELVCPRPLQIHVGSRDDIVPPDIARTLAPQARETYRARGADGSFEFAEADVGHDFVDEVAWPFVARHLGAPAPRPSEVE